MNTATTFLSVCSQASVKEWIGIGRWCEMRMGCDAQLDAAYWPVVVTFITAVWLQCLAELAAGQVTGKWDLVSRLPRRWFLAGFFRQANELEQNAKEQRTGKLHLARGRLSFVLTAVQRTGMQNVFLLNFIDKCSLQHATCPPQCCPAVCLFDGNPIRFLIACRGISMLFCCWCSFLIDLNPIWVICNHLAQKVTELSQPVVQLS